MSSDSLSLPPQGRMLDFLSIMCLVMSLLCPLILGVVVRTDWLLLSDQGANNFSFGPNGENLALIVGYACGLLALGLGIWGRRILANVPRTRSFRFFTLGWMLSYAVVAIVVPAILLSISVLYVLFGAYAR